MKTNPTDFIRTLRSIRLPSDLKARLRADLSAYADLHTLRDRVAAPIRSPFSALMFRTRNLYAGALALVLVLAGGTQASLAAEGAKPGDILYPVKVAVSEPIAFALSASSERKAELAARFASRRVDEAAALSSEGRLDEKTADELATRFDTHVDVLAKETDALEAKGDIAVSLAVRTDLEQKVSAKVDVLAQEDQAADTMMLSMAASAVAESEDPEDRFSARVAEKSRTLATTRERLDSALALDMEAEAGTGLAALRSEGLAANASSTSRFFANVASDTVSATLLLTGTTTATSTVATSTPVLETAEQPAPAKRLFSPFMNR